jgi:flagellar basal-body rod protein FlgB
MSTLADTNAFDYINVLDKAADASWLRNDAISNNIANADTPGYKRQDVDFESQLQKALKCSRYTSMDSKVANVNLSRLNPVTYTDYSGYSYRIDGNNVDPDTEGVYLAKNQVVYQGLTECINQEFENLQSVMK